MPSPSASKKPRDVDLVEDGPLEPERVGLEPVPLTADSLRIVRVG